MNDGEDVLRSIKGKSIAVVGNAEATIEYGKEIDAHQIVIRINKINIEKKYSHLFGSKIDILCTNGRNLPKNYLGKKIANKKIKKMNPKYIIMPFKRNAEGYEMKVFGMKKDWRKETGIKRLTTGSTLLVIMHEMNITADVYGFDFLKTGHYWEKHSHSEAHKKDIKMEEELIKNTKHKIHKTR